MEVKDLYKRTLEDLLTYSNHLWKRESGVYVSPVFNEITFHIEVKYTTYEAGGWHWLFYPVKVYKKKDEFLFEFWICPFTKSSKLFRRLRRTIKQQEQLSHEERLLEGFME